MLCMEITFLAVYTIDIGVLMDCLVLIMLPSSAHNKNISYTLAILSFKFSFSFF